MPCRLSACVCTCSSQASSRSFIRNSLCRSQQHQRRLSTNRNQKRPQRSQTTNIGANCAEASESGKLLPDSKKRSRLNPRGNTPIISSSDRHAHTIIIKTAGGLFLVETLN